MQIRIREKLDQLVDRLKELDESLSCSDVTKDLDRFRALTREHAEVGRVVALYRQYCACEAGIEEATQLLVDDELKALAQDELELGRAQMQEAYEQIQLALLAGDPNDTKNVIVEIRAGTGGDESALFAASLFRMYSLFADRQGWRIEIIAASESNLGGYKEIISRVIGQGAYAWLKFESGGHRVQRVPETETQGRIHTSACTVAVMPEVEEVDDVLLPPNELRIDTYRASGAGGQHINKTDSAVRVTHLPTGMVVSCQDGRSQHKNKDQAMRVLAAKLKNKQQQEAHDKEAQTRKSLIGSGDRSERIRTYNFPQGRVSDHRINLTLYKIEAILDGDMFELLQALMTQDKADRLAEIGHES